MKYYVSESGSAWVESIIDAPTPHSIAVAQVTGVEIIAALSRRVRVGTASTTDAAAAIHLFRTDFQTRFDVLPAITPVIEEAMNLAELHRIRGYDAMQLAFAVTYAAQLTARGGFTQHVSDKEITRLATDMLVEVRKAQDAGRDAGQVINEQVEKLKSRHDSLIACEVLTKFQAYQNGL